MSQPRFAPFGFAHHVTSRSINREKIFGKKEYKDYFVELLEKAQKKFNCKISNFCIMNTHFHLLIEPLGEDTLSQIMQWIKSMYARRYNKKEKRHGHVFAGRFKNKVIRTVTQFYYVFRYISRNVKDLPGKVKPEKYKHCGSYHLKKKITSVIRVIDNQIQTAFGMVHPDLPELKLTE